MIRKWTKRFLFVAASIAFLAWGIGERVFPHFGRAYPTRLIMLDFRNGGFILRWIENSAAELKITTQFAAGDVTLQIAAFRLTFQTHGHFLGIKTGLHRQQFLGGIAHDQGLTVVEEYIQAAILLRHDLNTG